MLTWLQQMHIDFAQLSYLGGVRDLGNLAGAQLAVLDVGRLARTDTGRL